MLPSLEPTEPCRTKWDGSLGSHRGCPPMHARPPAHASLWPRAEACAAGKADGNTTRNSRDARRSASPPTKPPSSSATGARGGHAQAGRPARKAPCPISPEASGPVQIRVSTTQCFRHCFLPNSWCGLKSKQIGIAQFALMPSGSSRPGGRRVRHCEACHCADWCSASAPAAHGIKNIPWAAF